MLHDPCALIKKSNKNFFFPLSLILISIENDFSAYLSSYQKQWESSRTRRKWVDYINDNPSYDNLKNSLLLFNHRFKNPYKIVAYSSEISEASRKNQQNSADIVYKFSYKKSKKILEIPENNNELVNSTKVKFWCREFENYEVDVYFNDKIRWIQNIDELAYYVHFFEYNIYNLVRRKEGKKK